VVVEDVGQQDRVPAFAVRPAEAGQVEVAGGEGQLEVALTEDCLDRRQVQHGRLQAGDGLEQVGRMGAGTAADVEQSPWPLQAGKGWQLAAEPGREVVEGGRKSRAWPGSPASRSRHGGMQAWPSRTLASSPAQAW
jgi:hypothetical protein